MFLFFITYPGFGFCARARILVLHSIWYLICTNFTSHASGRFAATSMPNLSAVIASYLCLLGRNSHCGIVDEIVWTISIDTMREMFQQASHSECVRFTLTVLVPGTESPSSRFVFTSLQQYCKEQGCQVFRRIPALGSCVVSMHDVFWICFDEL